jgi:hypothetical protein
VQTALSLFKCWRPRSSSGAQSGRPQSAFQDHSERIIPLSVMDLQAVVDAMPERCRAMVITQARTRSAVADLMARRVPEVDFLRRMVRVKSQTTQDGEQRVGRDTKITTHAAIAAFGRQGSGRTHRTVPASRGWLTLHTANGNRNWRQHCGAAHLRSAVRDAGLPARTTSHALVNQ